MKSEEADLDAVSMSPETEKWQYVQLAFCCFHTDFNCLVTVAVDLIIIALNILTITSIITVIYMM